LIQCFRRVLDIRFFRCEILLMMASLLELLPRKARPTFWVWGRSTGANLKGSFFVEIWFF
jgi:hypothetical protein